MRAVLIFGLYFLLPVLLASPIPNEEDGEQNLITYLNTEWKRLEQKSKNELGTNNRPHRSYLNLEERDCIYKIWRKRRICFLAADSFACREPDNYDCTEVYERMVQAEFRRRAAKDKNGKKDKRRIGRSMKTFFEPSYAKCQCDGNKNPGDQKGQECKSEKTMQYTPPTGPDDSCICGFDRSTEDVWPCYIKDSWITTECDRCDSHGFCIQNLYNSTSEALARKRSPCLCSPSRFCISHDGKTPPIETWTYLRRNQPKEETPVSATAASLASGATYMPTTNQPAA